MGDDHDTGSKSKAAKRPRTPRKASPARTLSLVIMSEDAEWTCLGDLAAGKLARRVATALARNIKLPGRRNAATVLLSSDAHVRLLNRQWRGQDKPTNVLSFPAGSPPGRGGLGPVNLGDLILAEETLADEAAELRITPQDHFQHLVLHGLLHLLGYDHETDAEAEAMEALETRILATIGVADPYAGSVPVKRTKAARAPKRSPPRAK